MEQFLDPEKSILDPETDIMGERNYILLTIVAIIAANYSCYYSC